MGRVAAAAPRPAVADDGVSRRRRACCWSLGARGTTATLMTLALIATAVANSGPLLGARHGRCRSSARCCWSSTGSITPLSFPIIGLAVLYFPHRAEILDRHRWIVPAVIAAALPMFVIGRSRAAFLLGVDAVLPALAWLAERGVDVRRVVRARARRQRPDRRRRHRPLPQQPRRQRAAAHPDRRLHRRAGGVCLRAEDRHPAARRARSAGRSSCRG